MTSPKDRIKKQAQQIANGEAPSSSSQLPGSGVPDLTPVPESTGTHNEAQTILGAITALSAKNTAVAQYLGQKLADAEEAFPRTMMQAYADRKAQYQAVGADTGSFLRALEGKVRAIESIDVRAALSGISNLLEPAPCLTGASPQPHD